MRNIHQSICSVIPPHMQRHVAEHGDDEDRENVASTLHHTSLILQEREQSFAAPRKPVVRQTKKRKIYDALHHQFLPGKPVFGELSRVTRDTDIEVREAFEGSGETYDFLAKVFHRNSIDDRGMTLISTVHYGQNYNNAMWNGKQMIYGDGDGKLFGRFTADIDVIGHELTHGMTQFTAALPYHDQPGALNESISDVVGIMIKQHRLLLTAAQSDWFIGEGILGPEVHGKAIRSMAAPGTAYDDPVLGRDPQPAHMRDYVHSSDDNGGVHINSGIPNHVFYLTATELGGYAWNVAGRIWIEVVIKHLSSSAGFQDFANATVAIAGQLYGTGGKEQRTVREAWAGVGIIVPSALTVVVAGLTGETGRCEPMAESPDDRNEPFDANLQLPAAFMDAAFEGPMSTGFEHSEKEQHITFESIDRAVKAFDIRVLSSQGAVQTQATRTDRLVTVYATARPIIVALSAIPLFPDKWRSLLKVFVASLDDVSAAFKAGKDLATAPVEGTPKADMEPKLPVG
jgi:hypothetical protein